jgi:hypothetical protein
MRRLEDLDEAPATGEEIAAAEHLVRVLAGAGEAGALLEAVTAARLLEAAGSGGVADEVARARLRRELVAAASARRPAWRIKVAGLAAALIVTVFGAVLLRFRGAPDTRSLGAREAEARAAVARIGGSASTDDSLPAYLQAACERAGRDRLVASFEKQRFERRRKSYLEELTAAELKRGLLAVRPTPAEGGTS